MKNGKIWGETQKIFDLNNISIHRIVIKKNACCSTHHHEHKYNMFFVESGKLLIKHWQNDYDLVDDTILHAGESCEIPPQHLHQFVALEDTVAYEIYYVLLDDKDIIRKDCGNNNYETYLNRQ